MHKAKSNKHIVAMLAVFAMVFSGLTFTAVAASATSPVSTCISAGAWSGNGKCGDTPTALSPNVSGTVGTALASSSPAPTSNLSCDRTGVYYLFASTDTAYATSLTSVAGLTFSGSTGRLSGTPTSTLTNTSYKIVAECTTGSSYKFKRYTLDVAVAANTNPYVTPATQTITGVKNSAITASATLVASNFDPATVSYAVRGGTIPAGLVFETTSGVFRGTPTAADSSTVTIDAADNASNASTVTVTFAITDTVPSNKVTICHRTHSETNPYVRITVNYQAVNSGGTSDHSHHNDSYIGYRVYTAGIYMRAKDKLWGDIIPPDPSGQNRWSSLNWETAGQNIYNNVSGNTACPAAKLDNTNSATLYNSLRDSGMTAKQARDEIDAMDKEQKDADNTYQVTNTNSVRYTGSNSKKVAADNQSKVTICHRTNSTTNPYRRITVAVSSLDGANGHRGHDEIYDGHHVFTPSPFVYPTNRKDWGDIIPPTDLDGNSITPMNWTDGAVIWNDTTANSLCPTLTTQEYYNKLRDDGKTKKEIKEDIKDQSNEDDNDGDVEDIKYTGTDPNTENSEPKAPTQPPGRTPIDQSLSGIVWLDLNRDGLKDPDEPLMKDITLSVVQTTAPASLSRVNPARFLAASVINFGRATVTTVQTDANGYYEFPSLSAGYWKAVTTVPADLTVTYDSQSASDGEVTALVPVGSFAFTWVGLVGTTDSKNQQIINNLNGGGGGGGGSTVITPTPVPTVSPAPVVKPTTPAVPVKKPTVKKPVKKPTAASINGRTELAYTGDNPWLEWMFSGLLLLAGLGLTGFGLRKAKRKSN